MPGSFSGSKPGSHDSTRWRRHRRSRTSGLSAFRDGMYTRMEEISFRTSMTVLAGVVAFAAVVASVSVLMSQSSGLPRHAALSRPATAPASAGPTSDPVNSGRPAPATPSTSPPGPRPPPPATPGPRPAPRHRSRRRGRPPPHRLPPGPRCHRRWRGSRPGPRWPPGGRGGSGYTAAAACRRAVGFPRLSRAGLAAGRAGADRPGPQRARSAGPEYQQERQLDSKTSRNSSRPWS